MLKLESIDNLLNRAFDLACFIQRDRDAAVQIVARALSKLEVVATAQGKRLYYKPSGRRWSLHSHAEHFRNRISFNEAHLLQRLIYIESEPYEIAQEHDNGTKAIGEEDLLIHFIKHLVRKTSRRNSFYVTLGLGRLLHSYTTAETMDIYNAVIQDPERVKDDYYFRSRKGALMHELKQRFGDLLKVCHGPRGEERFETVDDPGRFAELVRDCLSFFTPWNTPCLVPAGIDPIREGLPAFSGRNQGTEDEAEINRIHAVLHPDCFHRLIANLRFESPEQRLSIPRFHYANEANGNAANGSRRSPTLSEEELTAIKRQLDNNAAQRKTAHGGVLRMVVDGNERARLDVSEACSARFDVDSDAELIEVRSWNNAGEEVTLAIHPFAHTEGADEVEPANASITLEGGQKISIAVSPADDDSGATVSVNYVETNPFRAALLSIHQWTRSVNGTSRIALTRQRVSAIALAISLLTISLIAIIKYAQKRNPLPLRQPEVATGNQKGAGTANEVPAAGSTATEKNNPTEPRQRESVRHPAGNTAEPGSDTKALSGTAAETGTETRSTTARRADVPLSGVKKVYVEALGDDISTNRLRETIGGRLRSGGGLTVVSNRADADALLQMSIERGAQANPQMTVSVELINRRGTVIWPNTSSGGKYRGSVDVISAGMVNDLLSAIQQSKRSR